MLFVHCKKEDVMVTPTTEGALNHHEESALAYACRRANAAWKFGAIGLKEYARQCAERYIACFQAPTVKPRRRIALQ